MQRSARVPSVELVGDRFVVAGAGTCGTSARALDLATGDEVLLLIEDGGAGAPPGERAVARASREADTAWTARSGWFHRLRHPSIATLVDYGTEGPCRRFEAWGCGVPTRDSDTAHEVRAAAARFLRACGRTTDGVATADVHDASCHPVLMPPAGAGFEAPSSGAAGQACEGAGPPLPLAEHGVLRVDRQELRGLAEAVADTAGGRSRAVALWGVAGSGLRTATCDLARTARLQGVVPLAVSVAARAGDLLRAVLAGRSVLLIDRTGDGSGWVHLVEQSRGSPRSHILLLAGRAEVPRVEGLGLARFSEQTLVWAVQPVVEGSPVADRVLQAARYARGLPERFLERLWGAGRGRGPRAAMAAGRAAEHAPEYGTAHLLAPPEPVDNHAWAPPKDLAQWRRRAEDGTGELRSGRTAAGERELRAAVGGLIRRSDWHAAARALFALAASHLARGRPREAQEALREIDTPLAATPRILGFDLHCRMAVLSAAALGDLGHFEDAAQILSTALVAARGVGDPQAQTIALALARCRFWLAEYDEAWQLLAGDRPPLADVSSTSRAPDLLRLDVRRFAATSRLEVARGRQGAAIADAAAALRLAEALGEPASIALAAQASAFAFLAIGDQAAVDRDVARAVSAARAAHDPLRALKARLLAAECARKFGGASPAPWLRRAGQIAGRRLPATVVARIAILLDESGLPALEVVRRRMSATGLRALALFHDAGVATDPGVRGIDGRTAEAAARPGWGVMEDVLDLLRCCQGSDDTADALGRVLSLMRERLRAAGVGCYLDEAAAGSGAGAPILVAVDGRRPSNEMAARVLAAQQSIAPHPSGAGTEGGAPVRFDGRVVGAFVARWSIGAPVDTPRAGALLSTAATAAAPAVAAVVHRRRTPASGGLDEILGISQAIDEVRRAIESAAAAPYSVLIEGESGCGKELVARAVHRRSQRKDRPFCALNCAALPEDLLEAELFGHVRGAFTGAMTDRLGVFEAADGGTVFLDEVGELSPRAQAKLLRTLQEGEIRRVGETLSRQIDVRVVAATNRNLRQDAAAGRFRVDLLYRLDVVRITLAPLRARREDIPVLVDRYWREASTRVGSRATLSAATVGALSQYDWPGNVRELQNVLASLAVRGPRRGVVPPSALPIAMGAGRREDSSRLDAARRTFDERFVRAALVRTGGHRARAAQELGVSRQGLTKLMTRLGIRDNQDP